MAGINMPSPNKKGPWDALAQALSVAKDIYGITTDMSQLESAKAKDALDAKIKEQALKKGDRELDPTFIAENDKRELDKLKEIERIKGEESRKTGIATALARAKAAKDNKVSWRMNPETGEYEPQDMTRGKMLGPDKIMALSEAGNIPKVFSETAQVIDANSNAFGPLVGNLKGLNPWDEQGQAVQGFTRNIKQVIGKLKEGGVLRKEDEAKYEKMLPVLSDTPTTAKNKALILERELTQKYNDAYNSLGKSGYDVTGLSSPMSVPNLPKVLTDGPKDGKDALIPEAQASGETPTVKQVGDAIYVRKNGKWVRQ